MFVKRALVSLFVGIFVLVVIGCGTNITRTSADQNMEKRVLLESQNQVSKNETSKVKTVELYLPLLKSNYNSVYEHWDELKLDTVPLIKTPLLGTKDIEYVDAGSIKIKKKISIIKGKGIDTNILAADNSNRELEFVLEGKQYSVSSRSPSLFYNYYIHGICIVVDRDNIIFVKQREYVENNNRKYKKGPIGIPYVLVVDGKRSELGIIKVGEGNFAIPEPMDSWSYNGFPVLTTLIPEGSILTKGK
jgi:hypothetical protein